MIHILIPTNFSESTLHAASCAIAMHKQVAVRFHLMANLIPVGMDARVNLDHGSCHGKLCELKAQLLKQTTNHHEIVVCSYNGSFIENLRKAIVSYHIDFLVLSSACGFNTPHKQDASCVKEVITRLKCPVMLIPSACSFTALDQMVLIADFHFKHKAKATDTISKFMESMRAHLHIVQLNTSQDRLSPAQSTNKLFLKCALEHISHSFDVVASGSMATGLQRFITSNRINMVLLFAKHISLCEQVLFASVKDENINYHRDIPFLIIHE